MSIKQNGGVFGRNPTFNDVTIEGQLTFEGNIDIDSDITWEDGKKAIFGNNDDLQIYHDGNNSYIKDTGTGDLRIWADNPNISTASGNKIFYGNNGAAELYFTGGAKRLETTSAGVSIDGNLIIGTSGKGIDFSATSGTGTSELLDDYEEGEFSVTLTPSTSGSIALQTGADTMLYNKVGRVVHCQGQINVQSIASAVGSSIAVNLPFAKLNTTDASEASSGPVTYYNTSAYSVLPAYVPSSVTQAFNIVIDPSTLANGHVFYIQFSYTAA